MKRFWIQAGSFQLFSGAELAQKDLKQKGFQSYIATNQKDNKDFYRLRIGPFESKSEAEYYLKKVGQYKDYSNSYISSTISREVVQ